MVNKIIAGCVGIILGLVIFNVFYEISFGDELGPEIKVSESSLVYKSSTTKDELLSGVSAYDDKDGDVSDELTVVNVLPSDDRKSVVITYAAKDTKNNITLYKRELTAELSDLIVEETIEEETTNAETTNEETTNKETTVKETEKVEETTVSLVNGVKVIDEAAVNSSGIPAIELKQAEVTLPIGSAVNVLSYVKRTYDDGGKNVHNRIQVTGEYNMGVPGEYILTYYVTDQDNNMSEKQKLKLIVK